MSLGYFLLSPLGAGQALFHVVCSACRIFLPRALFELYDLCKHRTVFIVNYLVQRRYVLTTPYMTYTFCILHHDNKHQRLQKCYNVNQARFLQSRVVNSDTYPTWL